MAAPWEEIRTEYITQDTSYRILARKYGLDQSTIARRGKKEGWAEQRKRSASELQAMVLEADTKAKADRAMRLSVIADKLLDKVEGVLDDPHPINPNGLKAISEALRNVRDTQMIKSEQDMEEQAARIAKLRADAVKDDKGGTVRVVLEGELSEYGG